MYVCMCAKQHDDIVSLHPLFFPHSELVLMVCRLLVYWFPQEGLTGLLWYPLVDPYRPYHPYLQWPGHCGSSASFHQVDNGSKCHQISHLLSPVCHFLLRSLVAKQHLRVCPAKAAADAELVLSSFMLLRSFLCVCVGVKLAEGLHLSKPN